jgi:hypothetical protein
MRRVLRETREEGIADPLVGKKNRGESFDLMRGDRAGCRHDGPAILPMVNGTSLLNGWAAALSDSRARRAAQPIDLQLSAERVHFRARLAHR